MQEGNSYTNMLQLIKSHGYNKDVGLTVGTITSITPLIIDVDGMLVETEDVIITETMYDRINSTDPNKLLTVLDRVLVLIDGNNFYLMDRVVG